MRPLGKEAGPHLPGSLRSDGWEVLTIWECQARSLDKLEVALRNFLGH